MAEEHTHTTDEAAATEQPQVIQPPQPRQPKAQSIINNQGHMLNMKANEIRQLEDNKVFLLALIDDLEAEVSARDVEIASLRERLEKCEEGDAGNIEEIDGGEKVEEPKES